VSDLFASTLSRVLESRYDEILAAWVAQQISITRRGAISEADVRGQCAELLNAMRKAMAGSDREDLQAPGWGAVRDIIQRVSFTRAQQGFSPSETATFVLALKRPLFDALRAGSGQETETLADNTWAVTELLDKLALLSMEAYMRTREELIARQQQDMLELSTSPACRRSTPSRRSTSSRR
jgi:rsbT co-antagonist protein RsbR